MHKAYVVVHETPTAVIKHIQVLEASLDVKICTHSKRKLQLTPAGEKYYAHISTALNSIRHATREVSNVSGMASLKIRAYTTFSMYWLIPRLSSFHGLYPEINIELTTSTKWIDFEAEDVRSEERRFGKEGLR